MNFKNFSFSHLARFVGVLFIFVSFGNYLFRGFSDLNSIESSFIFVALTLLFGVLGIKSISQKENKQNSKIYFGVSLSLLPVLMTQTGSFIIERFQNFSNLSLETDLYLICSISASLFLCMVLPAISFKNIMEKGHKPFAFLFVISNLCVWVPSRNIYFIAITTIILGVLYYYINLEKKNESIHTPVGKIIALFPIYILIIRNLMYTGHDLYSLYGYLCLFGFLFIIVPSNFKNYFNTLSFQIISIIPLFIALYKLMLIFSAKYEVLYALSSFSVTMFLISPFAIREYGKDFRILGSILAGFSILFLLLFLKIHLIGLAALLCLILFVFYYFYNDENPRFIGIIGSAGVIVSLMVKFITVPTLSLWQILLISGVVLLVLSVQFESKDSFLRKKWRNRRDSNSRPSDS